MKYSILVAVFTLAINASAAPIFCGSETNAYKIQLSNDHKTAEVTKNGKPVDFGDLTCRAAGTVGPNQPFTVCHSPHVADAGFGAGFYYVQKSLIIRANIDKMTFAGAHRVADLPCVAAMNDLGRDTNTIFNVSGDKAAKIVNALEAVGAQGRHGGEISFWSVTNVKVEYTPRGFIWAQGTMTDKNSGNQLSPVGGTAFDLYSALKDAGVPSLELEGFIGSSQIHLNMISCKVGYSIGGGTSVSHCTMN